MYLQNLKIFLYFCVIRKYQRGCIKKFYIFKSVGWESFVFEIEKYFVGPNLKGPLEQAHINVVVCLLSPVESAVTVEDEERFSSVQDIQSPKLRCITANPSPPAVAQIPRPGTSSKMAGAARPPLSASAPRSSRMVPRRFIGRRNDRNSCNQTLHSEDASLECAHDHHHALCIVTHFSASTFSTTISIFLLFSLLLCFYFTWEDNQICVKFILWHLFLV